MRLAPEQIAIVLSIAREVMGEDVTVSVFGSRLDDRRRGGDLDVLVETAERRSLLQRAELKLRLETALHIPVDIVARARNAEATPFQALAMARATRLEMPR
ncbi:nucleotidyltransferase domain-containing protein [Aromatoleum evansii]|uniref:nucleotidyltransferase domain-containing protein n=1 Tax=Aromatoleum evansii TaxID=59406 RepID=UPI00145FCC8C|nr:nucleotidyltransferase domain-containing protein [Aromatoleum evansii]NMG29015.1 nucleotidyltransferase domain-containing protein [Aromatoleum evansii]